MFIVIRRYPMDDVPVKEYGLKRSAIRRAYKEVKQLYATEYEQELMGCDISCELCSVAVIRFDLDGNPHMEKIIPSE